MKTVAGSVSIGFACGAAILLVTASLGIPDGGCGGELQADANTAGENSDASVKSCGTTTAVVRVDVEKAASIYNLGNNLANGKGRFLMAGKQGWGSANPTTQYEMRGLVKFKQTGPLSLALIPSNATITEVTLSMKHMAVVSGGPVPATVEMPKLVTIKRAAAAWDTAGPPNTEAPGGCSRAQIQV